MKNAVTILSAAIATVLLLTTCTFGFDERLEAAASEFIPVQNIISGIPTSSYPLIGISLWGTVMPQNATNKKIEWSIKDDGGTLSTLEVNRLTANGDGTVTVTAVIKDGLGEGADYIQDFDILISLEAAIPVIEIRGIPASITRGNYTLGGYIIPSNASNTTIVWSVKDEGTTGADIYGHTLTTTEAGTTVLTATIANGLPEGDYTQDFSIAITKNVQLAGHYINDGGTYTACYWIDDTLYDLDLDNISNGTDSFTTGIVFAGSKQYISGGYGGQLDSYGEITTTTACYWADGMRHDLDGTQTFSIAADGDDVYIAGKDNNDKYCYWKIEGNAVTKTALLDPSSPNISPAPPSPGAIPNDKPFKYEGRLAVSGGKVYIPFYCGQPGSGNPPYISYYWDENGNYHHLADRYAASNVAIINGSVYFAGYLHHRIYNPDYPNWEDYGKKLSYLIMGNEPVSFFIKDSYGNNDEWGNGVGDVRSIIVQNGKILFYCGSGSSSYYFDTAENLEYLPDNYYYYDTGIVVSSDGDVYIASNDSYGEEAGYIVLGKRLRVLIDDEFYGLPSEGKITGIAIRSSL